MGVADESFRCAGDGRFALRGPVRLRKRSDALLGALGERRAALLLENGNQRPDRLTHVGLYREIRRIVLADLPVDEPDLDQAQVIGLRIDLAPHRHAQHVGTEHDHRVVRRERVAHLLLVAPKRADETGALRQEVRAIGDRRLERRTAEHFRELRRLFQRVALDDLVAAQERRPLRLQDPVRQCLEHFVRGAHARIDPGDGGEIDAGLVVEDVAGQRDEHRTRGRRHRHLRRAADDARQILEAIDLDRPLHQGLRDRHQGIVEQGLGQAVALLLLAGSEDDRGAGEFRAIERAHGVAEPGRDMDVAGREPARCAREPVGHVDDEALLHPHHVGEVRVVLQRMHDRQLGGARIAEQMGDALVLQQRQKCGAAGDRIQRHRLASSRSSCGSSLSEFFPSRHPLIWVKAVIRSPNDCRTKARKHAAMSGFGAGDYFVRCGAPVRQGNKRKAAPNEGPNQEPGTDSRLSLSEGDHRRQFRERLVSQAVGQCAVGPAFDGRQGYRFPCRA